MEDEIFIIVPIIESPITLERLLEQITEDNIHREVDAGTPAGAEVW